VTLLWSRAGVKRKALLKVNVLPASKAAGKKTDEHEAQSKPHAEGVTQGAATPGEDFL
jgi:hypothetical protein